MVNCLDCDEIKEVNPPVECVGRYYCNWQKAYMTTEVANMDQTPELICEGFIRKRRPRSRSFTAS